MTDYTTTQLEKDLYALCKKQNAEIQERMKREEAIDRESDEMVAAIENAQARIAEMLRFAGVEVNS